MNKKNYLLGALLLPAMAGAEGFIDDASVKLGMRNFYFNQDNRSGDAAPSKSVEWGQGFLLDAVSGFTPGTVGVGVDVFGRYGVRLDSGGRTGKAGRDRNPGGVFPLESDGSAVDDFGSLGVTAKLKVSKSVLRVGNYVPVGLPVIGRSDSRLLPQTYNGVVLTSEEIKDLGLTFGHIDRARRNTSSDNEALRIPNATQRTNQFVFAGADYRLNADSTLRYWYAELDDYYRQHFLGATYRFAVLGGTLTPETRLFFNDSTGANKRGESGWGREVDNDVYSLSLSYARQGHTLSAGYQYSRGDSDFPVIEGGARYVFTNSSQISKFASAGERAWWGTYNYDFAGIGLPGLTAGTRYTSGSHVLQAGSPGKEQELNFTVAYVVPSGPLKNLSLTLRQGYLNSSLANTRDRDETRVILGYTLTLL